MSNHIPIFCATDENYAPFASLMMKSVLMHTDSFIDFYIMDGGICDKTKKLIDKDLKKYPNKELYYIDMEKYSLDRFPDVSYYTTNAFSRYFIPSMAKDQKRVIYLDVDIIVKKDIKLLYEQDLEGCPIGAIPEDFLFFAPTLLKQNVWPTYKEDSSYFNSGVLLLDIQKLNEINFEKKAVDLTIELYHKLTYPDQDILNILFENNYKKMDYRFNFFPDRIPFFKKKYPTGQLSEPIIIHYNSIKPWKEKSFAQSEFNLVLQTSVFCKRVMKQFRSQKTSKYYLFGRIPLFERSKIKNI